MSSISLSQVLEWSKGRWVNEGKTSALRDSLELRTMRPLKGSGREDLCFFFSQEFKNDLIQARPGVLITGAPFVKALEQSGLPIWTECPVVAVEDPYLVMAVFTEKFAPQISPMSHADSIRTQSKTSIASARLNENTQIHSSAVISKSAEIGLGVTIMANVVIENHVKIGEGCVFYPGVYVGANVEIGTNCILYPRVSVYERTLIGHRVRLHAGVVVGSDGFGYAPIFENSKPIGHQKIFHLGIVRIGDDVEIGSNSCVDRGTFGETVIGNKAKIDNLVQVGHNVTIEEGAVICGSAALAGSVHLGKYVYVGGLTGIANKVHVGDYAKIGALSLITKDVIASGTGLGNPQREYREHFQVHAQLNKALKKKAKQTAELKAKP